MLQETQLCYINYIRLNIKHDDTLPKETAETPDKCETKNVLTTKMMSRQKDHHDL